MKYGYSILFINEDIILYYLHYKLKRLNSTRIENWVPIEGYENLYHISDMGNVKSLDRYIKPYRGELRFQKERILKIGLSVGYPTVNLCKNGDSFNCKIHVWVAKHFIPNPDNKPCVNHKNGIKTDNRVENLEWVTYSENTKHAFSTGLQTSGQGSGEKHNQHKLSNNDVLYIRSIPIGRKTTGELARKFNVKYSTIKHVINRITWKHI